MKALFTAFILAAVLCACAQPMERAVPPEPVTAKPVDMHTSRNSLDWAGIYEGILPGADRAGVKTRLTLNRDGTYERVTLPVGRQEAARTVRGSFAWQSSGNAIRLDEPGGGQQFAVGEGRLLLLHPEGGPAGTPVPNAVLTLVPKTEATDGLVQTLERYRWSLESATDGQNRAIEALSPRKDRPVVFEFSGARLGIQGPCNRMMGSYRISAANQLTVSGMASTNMACAPELMLADAALSGLLAKPLQVELDRAPISRLRLVSASFWRSPPATWSAPIRRPRTPVAFRSATGILTRRGLPSENREHGGLFTKISRASPTGKAKAMSCGSSGSTAPPRVPGPPRPSMCWT
jgi:heat shock protein HslJ